MLDKSVKYAGFFMRKKASEPTPDYPLPDGYRFVFYKDGDESEWARLETSVLEFDSEFAAIMRFKSDYGSMQEELYRRCIFIENDAGEKVATGTAWWADMAGQRRPWVQWISVSPAYQGKGLGKAVVAQVLRTLSELEGGKDAFLETQTWSYKAVGIYKSCGFEPTDEEALYAGRKHNYKKAMRILKRLNANLK